MKIDRIVCRNIGAVLAIVAVGAIVGCEKKAAQPPPKDTSEHQQGIPSSEEVPLDPQEEWCEAMLLKPNPDWEEPDFIRFSAECLYNDPAVKVDHPND